MFQLISKINKLNYYKKQLKHYKNITNYNNYNNTTQILYKTLSDNEIIEKCGNNNLKWEETLSNIAKEGDSDQIHRIINKMELNSITVTNNHLKYFFQACHNSKDSQLAYSELKKLHSNENKIEFNDEESIKNYLDITMKICGDAGDDITATKVLKLLLKNNTKLSLSNFENWMYSHAIKGEYQVAREILEYAKDYQLNSANIYFVPPNVHTYNILLLACANSKNIEMAVETFNLMLSLHLTPDERSWSLYILTYVRSGQLDEAMKLLNQMISTLQPSASSSSSTTTTTTSSSLPLSSSSSPSSPPQLSPSLSFSSIIHSSTNYIPKKQLSATPFNHLLGGYLIDENISGMVYIYSLMNRLNISPDKHTYSILFSAGSKNLTIIKDISYDYQKQTIVPDNINNKKVQIQKTTKSFLQQLQTIFSQPLTNDNDIDNNCDNNNNIKNDINIKNDNNFESIKYHEIHEQLVHKMIRSSDGELIPNQQMWNTIKRVYFNNLDFIGLKKIVSIFSSYDPFSPIISIDLNLSNGNNLTTTALKENKQFINKLKLRNDQIENWKDLRGMLWKDLLTLASLKKLENECKILIYEMEMWDKSLITKSIRQSCWVSAIRGVITEPLNWRQGFTLLSDLKKNSLSQMKYSPSLQTDINFIEVTPAMYHSILLACCRSSPLDEISQLLIHMYLNDHIFPTAVMWDEMIGILCEKDLLLNPNLKVTKLEFKNQSTLLSNLILYSPENMKQAIYHKFSIFKRNSMEKISKDDQEEFLTWLRGTKIKTFERNHHSNFQFDVNNNYYNDNNKHQNISLSDNEVDDYDNNIDFYSRNNMKYSSSYGLSDLNFHSSNITLQNLSSNGIHFNSANGNGSGSGINSSGIGGNNTGNGDNSNGNNNNGDNNNNNNRNLNDINDDIIPYDEQMKQFYSNGDFKSYLNCADKLLYSLINQHKWYKYSKIISVEFFTELIKLSISVNQLNKIEFYYNSMLKLKVKPNKELLYLISKGYNYHEKFNDSHNLLVQQIFSNPEYFPNNEDEVNTLLLPLFNGYIKQNNTTAVFNLYNLLLDYEKNNSNKFLLTDDIYCLLFDLILRVNYPLNNKYQYISEWIEHWKKSNQLYLSQNNNNSDNSTTDSNNLIEYFTSKKSDEIITQFLLSRILTVKNESLYGKQANAHEFCELFLKSGVSIYDHLIVYLDWIHKNLPSKIPKFLDLVFEYPTDINLWEQLCKKMRDLGMDDDLAWAIQCMEITQTSPSPSINCWLYLIDSYLSKNKDSEAWQIAIQTTELSLNNHSKISEKDVILCWYELFRYYTSSGNLRSGKATLDKMRELNLKPDHKCWEYMIGAAIKRNSSSEINKLMKEMETVDQLKPNLEIYTLLIEYHIDKEASQPIIQIIKEMELNKLSLKNSTWHKLQEMKNFDLIVSSFEKFN